MTGESWRRLRLLGLVLPVILVLVGCDFGPKKLAKPTLRYVALGDSFSSGEGVEPFERFEASPQHPDCHQSRDAYPRLVAAEPGLGFELVGFLACSGATTENVTTKPQHHVDLAGASYAAQLTQSASLATLGDVDLVTLTIGGNDIGFNTFAEACADPRKTDHDCAVAYSNSLDLLEKLPKSLAETYATIRAAGGADALVVVLGYPLIIPFVATEPVEDLGHCGSIQSG